MNKFFSLLLVLVSSAAFSAESWPKLSFSDWPVITVSQIKLPDPPLFRLDVPGSIQPKRFPVLDKVKYCQVKQPGGFYLPERCD